MKIQRLSFSVRRKGAKGPIVNISKHWLDKGFCKIPACVTLDVLHFRHGAPYVWPVITARYSLHRILNATTVWSWQIAIIVQYFVAFMGWDNQLGFIGFAVSWLTIQHSIKYDVGIPVSVMYSSSAGTTSSPAMILATSSFDSCSFINSFTDFQGSSTVTMHIPQVFQSLLHKANATEYSRLCECYKEYGLFQFIHLKRNLHLAKRPHSDFSPISQRKGWWPNLRSTLEHSTYPLNFYRQYSTETVSRSVVM